MLDADTFVYDGWAWRCRQVPLLLSFQCCFCAGDNETCQRSTQLAFSPRLTKTIRCHINNGTNWTQPSVFISCCFRKPKRSFPCLWSLMHCNIVLCFWACASLLWRVAPGMTEHKATGSIFSVLYCTNKVSIRLWMCACRASAMSWIYEMLQSASDTLPTIHWLLNKSAPQRFQVFYYSGKIQFHFEWIQSNKTES